MCIRDRLKGLKYMHSASVLHRDIKPGNLLIIDNSRVTIGDFGLARSIANYKEFIPLVKGGEKMKEERKAGHESGIRHQLSGYVVTRWYRAPEVILSQADYGAGIDVWAVGCVFAELLARIKGNHKKRIVLFPGTSCYPFSPSGKTFEHPEAELSQTDQLSVIISVLGKPDENDCMFIKDPMLLETLKKMPEITRKDLSKVYPYATADSIDLLNRMLIFNPHKRVTVDQCLDHVFFADIKNKELELLAPSAIVLEFEDEVLDEKRLKELFMEDILHFEKLRQAGEDLYK
eukprot:TRINITY_DN9692_c0_g1_i1.p1 TRINITY_DN9692_c0_g1~~TRINITY_DN9692_c0_g1_i1.p1  ORF type:complete len:289 (+),score=86.28 TRINITY_DN9692_c0_g1_i1:96-962(+)